MIKECILAKTGIQFDLDYLRDALDFDFDDLVKEMKNKEMAIADLGEAYEEIENYAQESLDKKKQAEAKTNSQQIVANGSPHFHGFRHYIHDVFDRIFDQLAIARFWWILEILPLRSTNQDDNGNWIRRRRQDISKLIHIQELIIIIGVISVEAGTFRSTKTRYWSIKLSNFESRLTSPRSTHISQMLATGKQLRARPCSNTFHECYLPPASLNILMTCFPHLFMPPCASV